MQLCFETGQRGTHGAHLCSSALLGDLVHRLGLLGVVLGFLFNSGHLHGVVMMHPSIGKICAIAILEIAQYFRTSLNSRSDFVMGEGSETDIPAPICFPDFSFSRRRGAYLVAWTDDHRLTMGQLRFAMG